jgi:hypothetical protein
VGKNEAMLKGLSVLNEFIAASARTFQTFFAETQLVRLARRPVINSSAAFVSFTHMAVPQHTPL